MSRGRNFPVNYENMSSQWQIITGYTKYPLTNAVANHKLTVYTVYRQIGSSSSARERETQSRLLPARQVIAIFRLQTLSSAHMKRREFFVTSWWCQSWLQIQIVITWNKPTMSLHSVHEVDIFLFSGVWSLSLSISLSV